MATETTDFHEAEAQPLACALTPGDLKTRLEDWRALRRDALVDEGHDGLVWTTRWRRSAGVRARLEALIEGEKACCPFLTFEVDELDDVIRVRTLFPPGAEGMPEAMLNAVSG